MRLYSLSGGRRHLSAGNFECNIISWPIYGGKNDV